MSSAADLPLRTPQPVNPRVNPRLGAMLHAPIVSTLFKLAWPNLLMMVAQASTGLVETWFLAKLGTDALAGAALVIPVLMLMQNMSGGAMGGGISSAIARALGAGRDANDLARHAVALNGVLGALFAVALLISGPWLFRAMGGGGDSLDAALAYGSMIAIGMVPLWVMNAFASVVRGTGNMVVPGLVICGGALLLVPLSPCLIFGIGPLPRLGVAGAGLALVLYYVAGALILGWYCASGRNVARLERGPLHWSHAKSIFSVGALATLNPLLTNGLIAATTALVGAFASNYAGTASIAGYGTAARLEYLVIPIAFGIGAPLVAMVGSNIGAGQPARALRIALTGGALAFGLCEAIGIAAAIRPDLWMHLFSRDPDTVAVGSVYLQMVGPVFGCFGLGFTLYFASQGAGRLKWPLLSGFARLVVAVGGGWLALAATGSLRWFFGVSALAMLLYGVVTTVAVASGVWFTPRTMKETP
jgi:putative MATE family efflux protein